MQVMRDAPLVLAPEMEVSAASDLVKSAPLDAWPVADEQGLRGMIRDSDLKAAVSNGHPSRMVAEIVGKENEADQLPHVHPDHSLSLALERMGTAKLHVLPVVSRANVSQLLGIVVLEDVLDAYGVGAHAVTHGYNE